MIYSGTDPGACWDTGVSYKISYSRPTSGLVEDLGSCKYVYTGQTGKNGYTRGKKHIDDMCTNMIRLLCGSIAFRNITEENSRTSR